MFDTIVAGVGGMGSAALYHLAKRGQRALGLERFELGHDRGSSHGETRVIRLAYFEGSQYVPIVQRAHRLWHDLSAEAGEPLIYITGSLEMAEPGHDFVARSRASCVDHDLRHEMLDAAELVRRFPAFRLHPDTQAIYQPDGGYVLSEEAVRAHAALAIRHGAELHTGETVLEFRPTADGGVEVRTDRARYAAGRLVLSAGPWMRQLVPELSGVLATYKQAIAWFAPARAAWFAPDVLPVFIHFSDKGEFYGIPMHGGSGFKLGGPHFAREPIDPDLEARDASPRQLAALRGFLGRHMPEAVSPPVRSVGCIYTVTPDEHFIIDTLPGMPQVLVVSPCSGHGFKFAPAIGEIAADLVTKGATGHDISLFSMARFAAAPAIASSGIVEFKQEF